MPDAKPPVSREHALHLLREMALIRRFEEKSAELYMAGKIRGFLHLYIGEEAVAVGAMRALAPDDAIGRLMPSPVHRPSSTPLLAVAPL